MNVNDRLSIQHIMFAAYSTSDASPSLSRSLHVCCLNDAAPYSIFSFLRRLFCFRLVATATTPQRRRSVRSFSPSSSASGSHNKKNGVCVCCVLEKLIRWTRTIAPTMYIDKSISNGRIKTTVVRLLLLPKRMARWTKIRARTSARRTVDQWQSLHGRRRPHACVCARWCAFLRFENILPKWTAAGNSNSMICITMVRYRRTLYTFPDDGSECGERLFCVSFRSLHNFCFCCSISFSFAEQSGRQTDAKWEQQKKSLFARTRTYFFHIFLFVSAARIVICVSLLRVAATPLCVCVCVHIYVLDFCLFCAHSFAPTDDDAVCVGTLPHCACGLCSIFPDKTYPMDLGARKTRCNLFRKFVRPLARSNLYGCTKSMNVSCSTPTHIVDKRGKSFGAEMCGITRDKKQ